jgi:hypothetical protein
MAVKTWAPTLIVAIIILAALYGAEAIGFNKGEAAANTRHHTPNFESMICFWLGHETSGLSKTPENDALYIRAKNQCAGPEK